VINLRTLLPINFAIMVLVSIVNTAYGQMPADTQFVQDIRDHKYADTMAYLVNGGTPNARDYNDIPAIVAAASVGDAGMVKELLKYGAIPDLAVKGTGMTALMQGAMRGDVMVIAVLATSGATLDLPDDLGETALIKAVKEGRRTIVRHLLDAGADPELTDYSGYSAYDHAQRSRDNQIRAYLKRAVSAR